MGHGALNELPDRLRAARLFSQAEVESLAGIVSGPDGVTGEVLTGGRLWDENQSLHFGAGSAQVSPAKCSGVLAWAMSMSAELPAAGTFIVEGQRPAHSLRVAAKNGTLYVQATMPLADPSDYRNEANRLTGYINQVVRGEQQLLDGASPSPSPGPGPAPGEEPPGGLESS